MGDGCTFDESGNWLGSVVLAAAILGGLFCMYCTGYVYVLEKTDDMYKAGYEDGYDEHNETFYNECNALIWNGGSLREPEVRYARGYVQGYRERMPSLNKNEAFRNIRRSIDNRS